MIHDLRLRCPSRCIARGGRPPRGRALACTWVLLVASVAIGRAQTQDSELEGLTLGRVEVQGLETISEGFVRRVIKARVGQPFSSAQVEEDVRELLRTRKFLSVFAEPPRLENNQVVLVYQLAEKPVVRTVEVEGNKAYSSDELFKELSFAAGQAMDRYEIDRGRENIERRYKEGGYYYAQVKLDEAALQNEARVVYSIVEGPRVKVRDIELEGARAFPQLLLFSKIRTQTYLWIFRAGALDEEQAQRDAVALQEFYRSEGYLDARVGYRLQFDSVERTDLTLVFVFEEGPRYTIDAIRIEGAQTFTPETVRAAMQLSEGAAARDEDLQLDLKKIRELYGEIGFVDARVQSRFDYYEDKPGVVALAIDIAENRRSRFDRISIRGNAHTKDEVIRRELRFYPGEDYNTVKTARAEQRLRELGLFARVDIRPLDDVDGQREALVEVEEGENIFFNVGFGVSTDNGVFGTVTVENRNFDLFDWPRWDEWNWTNRFRGDGQRLRLSLEPGTEVSRFRIDFTEPYLFDQPLRYDQSLYLFQRFRESYTEERIGFVPSLGKRFESGPLADWAVEGALRIEGIDIDDVDPLAANDIRDVRGGSTLTSVKASLVRDTTDSRFIPSQGYRFSLSWEQVGALGGDYDFGKPAASAAWYKTLATDIFDRKSVLSVHGDVGYITGDAPVFERFYAGGFGSIRGFDYRSVSPHAGLFNDRVGGDFIVLTGAEYSFPVYADNIRGVTFLDMGTVEEDLNISSWRASVGFGLRVVLPVLGGVPLVFDFGFPIAKDDMDEDQIFNFSIGASF